MRSRAQTGVPKVGVFITPQLRQAPCGDLGTWQLIIFGTGARTVAAGHGQGLATAGGGQESQFSEGLLSLQAADIPPPPLQAGCLKHGCTSHSIFLRRVQVTLGMDTLQWWQSTPSGAASQAGGECRSPSTPA